MQPEGIQPVNPQQANVGFDLQRQEINARIQRNAIAADLREIQAALRFDLLKIRLARGEEFDAKTRLLLGWYEGFCQTIENADRPHQVFETFVELLKNILVDSIFHSALDENCLLGNDGGTYTEMGLQLFRHLAPAHLQDRCPRNPERVLETSPHPYAIYMVRWLRNHNIEHRNAQNAILENTMRELNLVINRLPPLAINQNDLNRQWIEQRAQRHLRRERERNARVEARALEFEHELEEVAVPVIRQQFQHVANQVNVVAQAQLQQAGNLNQDLRQEINVLEPAINIIDAQLGVLGQRQIALGNRQNQLQGGIVILREAHRQLEAQKIELEKQIKEAEKDGLKALGKALLMIGACLLGNIILKCVMEALNAAVSGTTLMLKSTSDTVLLETTFTF